MNYFFSLVYFISFFSFGAFAQNDGWKMGESKNNIQFYYKTDVDGKQWMRLSTVIPSSLYNVSNFTLDVSKLPEWVYGCSETEIYSNSEDETIYYAVTDMPFPMTDRYMIIKKSLEGSPSGEYFKATSTDCSETQIETDLIRVSEFKAIWKFEKHSENSTKVTYDIYTSPDVPSWLEDKVKKVGPYNTLLSLREKFTYE